MFPGLSDLSAICTIMLRTETNKLVGPSLHLYQEIYIVIRIGFTTGRDSYRAFCLGGGHWDPHTVLKASVPTDLHADTMVLGP